MTTPSNVEEKKVKEGTRDPIVVIDVTMQTGEQEQIVIFESDNPEMIVNEFC